MVTQTEGYLLTPGDTLRFAVALAALQHKPPEQAVESYALDLRRAGASTLDWRTLALNLEKQLRIAQVNSLTTENASATSSKKSTKRKNAHDALPSVISHSSTLPQILSSALRTDASSDKYQILRGRLVPDMAWAFKEGILFPAVDMIFELSWKLYKLSSSAKPSATLDDPRPGLLQVITHALELLPSREERRLVGRRAVEWLEGVVQPDVKLTDTGDPQDVRIVRKDALWYWCAIIVVAGLEQKDADRLVRQLSRRSTGLVQMDEVVRDLVEGTMESAWLELDK
ncbi:hypothetical protein CYLTODRAFT_417603 [Cylindrobasidium torrendii FP15055 ss-10]|uniref:Uncharacterized protein n=1 Tax=Cylindrobasidium torrendii FP15055 ss-10 TaxID=1314674 RepID=A0A0D7BQY1_9AGAR|nr:hypothetical protein CYLTODRAFT_417603 [Cylindrobasidium torrendii FP15055 ss-10]